MLETEALSVDYGGLHALSDVSISVERGSFVAIVGANGAGKSTLFKALSGSVSARSGRILLDGQEISNVPASRRPHLGLAHVPEGRQVFTSLNVMENLELGAYTSQGRANWAQTREFILSIFPILAERRNQLAGTLSGGQQQMLAIGRGLAAAPRVLLLDEPSMGLSPVLADEIFSAIQQIHREQGMTILLVEQRVGEALESCDHGYLLDSGRIVAAGTGADLMKTEVMQTAYLGL